MGCRCQKQRAWMPRAVAGRWHPVSPHRVQPISPLLTLEINVLANKYPNKYPKTDFFGYFSYIRVPIMKPEAPARLPALF